MKPIELRGDEYVQFSRFVYKNNYGSSDLSELKNWEQPLKFKEKSYFLQQQAGGPCGVYAAFNSHIVYQMKLPENASKTPEQLFNSVILDIFKRVSIYSNSKNPEYKPIYVFCDCLIPENNFIHFQYTESPKEASDFLTRTRYINAYNSCLGLTLSIIFASLGMNEFRNPSEYQYICSDKMTSMALVFLILNGSIDPISNLNLSSTDDSDFDGFDQKEIGIRVLDEGGSAINNSWLNRKANIFVCLKFSHFYVVEIEGDQLIVYDSLNPRPTYKIDRKRSGW